MRISRASGSRVWGGRWTVDAHHVGAVIYEPHGPFRRREAVASHVVLLVGERDDGGDAGLLDKWDGNTRLCHRVERFDDEEIDTGCHLLADAPVEECRDFTAVGGAELRAAFAEVRAESASHVAVRSGGLSRQRHRRAVQLLFAVYPAHAPRHGLQDLSARPGKLPMEFQNTVRMVEHGHRHASPVTAKAAPLKLQKVPAVAQHRALSQAFQKVLWHCGAPFDPCGLP